MLFTIKKSNAQDKWSLERSNARRNLCATNLAHCFLIFQRIVRKKTKSIYIVPRTYNMLHECLFPTLSRSRSLAISITFHLGSTCSQVWIISSRGFSVFQSFFLGNEKTINHCANEVPVWATLTSIFLMPFLILFLSFFIVKCNID